MRRSNKKRRGDGGQREAALEAKGLAISVALEEQRRRQSSSEEREPQSPAAQRAQGREETPTPAVSSLPGFIYDAATDRYYPKPKGKQQQQQQQQQQPSSAHSQEKQVGTVNLETPMQHWLLAREVGGRRNASWGSALDALLASRIRSRGVYSTPAASTSSLTSSLPPLPVSSVPRLHFDQLGYHCCFADRYVNFSPLAVKQVLRAAATSETEAALHLAVPSGRTVLYTPTFQAIDVRAHPASLVQAWLYVNHSSGGEVRLRVDNLLDPQLAEPFDVKLDDLRAGTREPVSRIEWISCREALFLFSGDRIRELHLQGSTPLVTCLQDAAPRPSGSGGPAHMRAWHVWRAKHEQEKLVLVARRNGCIQLADVRTGLGAREAALGSLPFCPQHIVGLGDGHTVVASDICGTVRIFDVRGGSGGGSGGGRGKGHVATIVPTDANTASIRRCNDFWVGPGEGMIVVSSPAAGLQLCSIRGADQICGLQPPLASVSGPSNTVLCANNAHMLAEGSFSLAAWLGCFGIAPSIDGGQSARLVWPALDGVL